MGFRYVIETKRPIGGVETTSEEISGDEIQIGRGSDCQIKLTSKLVSVHHARLILAGDRLIISDLNSLSGVAVNNNLIREHTLKRGDSIRLGDIILEVDKDGGGWILRELRDETRKGKKFAGEKILEQAKQLQLRKKLPSYVTFSIIFSVLVFFFFFFLPIIGINQGSWDSGQISNAHKVIAADCKACHAVPFKRVADDQCLACHNMTDHHPILPKMIKADGIRAEGRCAECHMEHNGENGLFPIRSSTLCISCHGGIEKFHPNAVTKSVESIAEHPEFAVLATFLEISNNNALVGSNRPIPKIALSDKAGIKDGTKLKLNHKIHLAKDIAGPDGKVTLQCASCHELSDDLMNTKPISFEKHCAECHNLQFDIRLPGAEVPHGDPNNVFQFLYREYAKLFLAEDGRSVELPTTRQRPGGIISRAEQIEFTRQAVQGESRKTEKELFTKTACQLCHFVTELSENLNEETNVRNLKSNFKVEEPKIPTQWLPSAIFNHGSHEFLDCQQCHRNVSESVETTDVLLPGIADCVICHSEKPSKGEVRSECITCHSFHKADRLAVDKKRSVQEFGH